MVDVGGNMWQDECLKFRENIGSEMTNFAARFDTSSDECRRRIVFGIA